LPIIYGDRPRPLSFPGDACLGSMFEGGCEMCVACREFSSRSAPAFFRSPPRFRPTRSSRRTSPTLHRTARRSP
jgi:hypothetical protein